MNGTDNEGVSDAADPHHVGLESLPKGRLIIVRGTDRRGRASSLTDDEGVVLSLEKSATAREDVAYARENVAGLREDAAHLHEEAAQVREGEVYTREGAAILHEQEIYMVQQANAHLVIAAIDAQILAEQIRMARDQLEYLAHHDVLTDLPNRLLLKDRLGQAIELARRQGRQLAVMYMDLDQFKYINDSLGHAVGDQLLQSVAQRLASCVRQSDTLSRQGGDEFVLMLPFIQHTQDAAFSAQKIFEAFRLPHHIDLHNLHVSMSIGISIYPDDGQDAETLLKSADTAMYGAKETGRNNYKFFEQSMNVRAVQRQSTEVSLRAAMERQEFVLYYQPKINLHNGAVVGVEVLIRWQHPERGLLLPAQFVSIAEDCGLMLPIGRWVLHTACNQAQVWRQAGLPAIIVAVNTSALEFRAKDFIENVRSILKDTGYEPCYLELELTENILMQDAVSADSVLHALAGLGVKLAIDDFGTGYSSLSYLRQFPINTLKIDQSFVSQMTRNSGDAAIVTAVISMAKSLKLRVIAEGVETPEQYAFLLAQQCDGAQGYYFGEPVAAEVFATLLQTGISPALFH